jgi:predicted transcriptional regulator
MTNKVIKHSDEIKLIKKSTALQSECELWLKERRTRLTTSNFGTICKLRRAKSRANIIKSMLYKTFRGNEHIRYDTECELFSKIEFQKLIGFKIQ